MAGLTLGGCGASGVPATATVTTIDRLCTIVETTTHDIDDPRANGRTVPASEQRTYKDDCKLVSEWDKVRTKRTKTVDGEAKVHVNYTRKDGKSGSATLTFDGRDDEFYDLKAGDSFDVLVDEQDPTRVRKA
jgi:hypothetical protein